MNEPHDVAAAMNRVDRVAHHYSMSVDEVSKGEATVSMTVTEAMTNGLGVCHGGLIFTLADTAMAYGSNSHDIPTFSTTATIEWLRPASAGVRLTATSRRIADRGRNEIHDVTVTDEAGETIALVRGHTLTTTGSVVERAGDQPEGSP